MIDARYLHAEVERLTQALMKIEQWSRAWPRNVFPEPDLDRAHALLEAGGMSLDVISASTMRRVMEEVGRIARRALDAIPETGDG